MSEPQKLAKTIGIWSATTIVIGSIIGSGIFMKPATMAAQLGSPYMLIIVWLVAGVISICGAMAFAELGTMFPETGGQYIYLRNIYGDFIAYLYGWSSIAVINSATIAAIAFVCAGYADSFLHLPHLNESIEKSITIHIPMIGDIRPLENFSVKMLAMSIIIFLSIANYLSVRSGNAIQLFATILKTAAILLLVFGILFSGVGSVNNFFTNAPGFNLSGWQLVPAFMAATTGAFMSYDGWCNVNMVAGEIKNPEKNITKSLIAGVFTCIVVYVLVTLAYMYVLPIAEMAGAPLVANDAIQKVMGDKGVIFIAILIVVSTFGATSVNLLACARVIFAMSEKKNFFPEMAKVHPRFNTPGNAVLLLGIWSSILVMSGSFDLLADMFIFMGFVFYALVVAGVFILRNRMPNAERPYKTWGYPVMPFIFVLFSIAYLFITLYSDISNYNEHKSPIINSVFGLILTAIGIPLYFYFRSKRRKENFPQ